MTLPGHLRKLRGRSFAELRARGAQLASSWNERLRLRAGRAGEPGEARLWTRLALRDAGLQPGDTAALLADFRQSGKSLFFAGVEDRAATITELLNRWPHREAEIIARAERLRSHTFDLLGYKALHLGQTLEWHKDAVAGRGTDRTHWSVIPFLDFCSVGDHKVIWELNRHQYFLTLGRAYWLTGDERYAGVIARHLSLWMDANPPHVGINWASSLEVSFRALSWLWALHFLRESPELSPALFARTLTYLDLHARHIEAYLSTYFSPNTHLTGEALGLLALGTCLPRLKASERWQALGRRVLEEQIARQVRPDGVYVEQSPYYQRYTLEIYLHAVALARRSGRPLQGVDERLGAALECAMYLTMPDGTFPMVGDDDGGQLLPLDGSPPTSYRPVLSTAAVLYRRADYAAISEEFAEQTLWLLGPSAAGEFDRLDRRSPDATSRAFRDGGFLVMRDDWTETSNYLMLDAGPHGFKSAGHGHADALSIVVSVAGHPILVDPGTGVYVSADSERNRFRGTAAHNTVTVDGASSSEPSDKPFQWRTMANSSVHEWRTSETFDHADVSHDGFARLDAPAQHRRSILYIKGEYWAVRDRILSDGLHDIAAHFHFASDVSPRCEGPHTLIVDVPSDPGLRVMIEMVAEDGAFELIDDYVCPEYGRRVASKTAVFRRKARGSTTLTTFIIPMWRDRPAISEAQEGVIRVERRSGDFDTLQALDPSKQSGESTVWNWARHEPGSDRAARELTTAGTRSAGETAVPTVGSGRDG
jgi:hypothetical protein